MVALRTLFRPDREEAVHFFGKLKKTLFWVTFAKCEVGNFLSALVIPQTTMLLRIKMGKIKEIAWRAVDVGFSISKTENGIEWAILESAPIIQHSKASPPLL